MTSFSAVYKLRKILNVKKAGHAGTLDPFATGVLPVVFGNCTRFLELFPSHDKSYLARLKLGVTTDTLDLTGTVLSETQVSIGEDAFRKALSGFVGEISQTPPMYSAIKKDGVRLYELARKGLEVERESRRVTVHSIELLGGNGADEYEISVTCSAGTYIRSLAEDIGDVLGCGAMLTALRRSSALGFTLEKSYSLQALEALREQGRLDEAVVPIDEALGYERVRVTKPQGLRFQNGGELDLNRTSVTKPGLYCVYSPEGDFLGIGEAAEGSEQLKARKVLPR